MINKIKNFFTNAYYWIRRKIRWILVATGIVGVAIAAPLAFPKDVSFERLENVVKIDENYLMDFGEDFKIEIGDFDKLDFEPTAKLKRWGEECSLKVKMPTTKKIKPNQEDEKLKWKDKDKEVHFYDAKIGEKKDKDAFEFEIILKKKPKVNIVSLDIETKGLKFLYQPKLTQEEVDEGCIRPENVVGSYAVYHSTKQGDYTKMGGKNYRAGKAFHIYRPKIIDNAGTEVWGKLNITDNLLTVEIPQEFLDNAVYPVRHAAGLTFGDEGIGGTLNWPSFEEPHGSYFAATGSGNATKLTAYIYNGYISQKTFPTQCAIYDKDNSNSREGITAEVNATLAATTGAWKDYALSPNVSVTNGTNYWLVAWSGDGGGGGTFAGGAYDSNGADKMIRHNTTNYSTWPDPLVKQYGYTRILSIYCTYTAALAVTVQAASSVEETTATGNGNITSLGADPNADKRGFVYDTSSHADPGNVAPGSTDYASYAEDTNGFGTGAFTKGLTSLSKGTKYYIRAYAHGSGTEGYDYSNTELNFTTKPDEPSGFSATTASASQINLAWTKGAGAEKTMIRRKVGSYPATPSSDDQAYFDTGTSYNDTGLSCETHYYYRAWSYKTGAPNSGYSDTYVEGNDTTSTCTAGWLSGWDKRVKLTTDNTDIDSTLSNFPILVYLSTSSGRNSEDISFVFDELTQDANRKKIAITQTDGETECYVEIEKWDDASEKAWLWIKAPSVSNSANTEFYLYYDKDHADNTSMVKDAGDWTGTEVWDTNFKGVWHLHNDPGPGNAGDMKDSTGNNNDGQAAASMTTADLVDAKIGEGIDLDGGDDYIKIPDADSLDISGDIIISAWVHLDTKGDWERILAKRITSITYMFGLDASADQKWNAYLWGTSGTSLSSVGAAETGAGTWTYIVMTLDGTTLTLYKNGAYDNSTTHSSGIAVNADDVQIGRQLTGYNLDGIVDEIRISNNARSSSWIKASYESGRDDLLDFGSEETPSARRILKTD